MFVVYVDGLVRRMVRFKRNGYLVLFRIFGFGFWFLLLLSIMILIEFIIFGVFIVR